MFRCGWKNLPSQACLGRTHEPAGGLLENQSPGLLEKKDYGTDKMQGAVNAVTSFSYLGGSMGLQNI